MTVPTRPIKCLLVDDLEDNLLVLEALLRRDGLEILKAKSGQEALESCSNTMWRCPARRADAAYQWLRVGGVDAGGRAHSARAEYLRDRWDAERPREFRGYDAGAMDFLFKPIEPRNLRHKAETFFQLYRHRQTLAETLRLNEELMAVVGHDLRNPLNVILMTADLLSSKCTGEAHSRPGRSFAIVRSADAANHR